MKRRSFLRGSLAAAAALPAIALLPDPTAAATPPVDLRPDLTAVARGAGLISIDTVLEAYDLDGNDIGWLREQNPPYRFDFTGRFDSGSVLRITS